MSEGEEIKGRKKKGFEKRECLTASVYYKEKGGLGVSVESPQTGVNKLLFGKNAGEEGCRDVLNKRPNTYTG